MLFNKAKDRQLKIAYAISRIFEPFFLLGILGVVIIFSDYFIGFNRLGWAIGLVLILGVLPLTTLWLGVKKIKGIDIDFTKKERRTPFILIILFYWLMGMLLAWGLGSPKLILSILLVGVIMNLIVLIINFYWKVSNHSLAITVVIFFIIELYGWQYAWLFLSIPLVSWARWIQKKHTIGQLVGGVLLGILAWELLRILGY